MSRLVLSADLLSGLRTNLLRHKEETCAVLFGRSIQTSGRLVRIVVRESELPQPNDYSQRSAERAELRPEYVAKITQKARHDGQSVVFVHTHPFSLNTFSSIDDEGESKLALLFRYRIPNSIHASLLITPKINVARELGKNNMLRVIGVGKKICWGETSTEAELSDYYDRQIRVFGVEGQRILGTLRVGVVGLGGTGSIVLQQLAYLGVSDFLLIDPDVIEESNLNRVLGAIPSDVGLTKIDVAASAVKRINPQARVTVVKDSVLKSSVVSLLADTDFVFCCTDSHGSRAILNQFAYQYVVPLIDMGVVIASLHGQTTHIACRTQMLAPGLACLVCGNLLDSEQVRRDLLTDFERQADPYIINDPQPSPSVISFNSTIASLSITMFLNAVLGIPGSARFLNYNAISGVCRPATCIPHPACIVCSSRGAFARADEWPLPARLE